MKTTLAILTTLFVLLIGFAGCSDKQSAQTKAQMLVTACKEDAKKQDPETQKMQTKVCECLGEKTFSKMSNEDLDILFDHQAADKKGMPPFSKEAQKLFMQGSIQCIGQIMKKSE